LDDCIIGINSTILTGAKIGSGCIVGAGSVVKENSVFPPGSLIVGIPAKVSRQGREKEHKEMADYASSEYERIIKEYKEGLYEIVDGKKKE